VESLGEEKKIEDEKETGYCLEMMSVKIRR